MDVNEDFVDIAKGFIDNGVEFLIVGAYALGRAAMARNKLASGRPKDLVDAELLQSDD